MNELAMDRVGIDGVNGLLTNLKRRDRFALKFQPRDTTNTAATSAASATRATTTTSTSTTTTTPGSRSRRWKPHASSETRSSATVGSSSTTNKNDGNPMNHSSTLDHSIYQDPNDTTGLQRTNSHRTAATVGAAIAAKDINTATKVSGGESNRTIELLKAQGFTTGLAMALDTNSKFFDHRIWIVDNSASMEVADGHRIVLTSDRKMVVQDVTRWEELQDTVAYHAEMAAVLQSPTVFTLLNHPGPGFDEQHFSVATSGHHRRRRRLDSNNNNNDDGMSGSPTEVDIDADDVRKARTFIRRVKPSGTTPLTDHIWKIQESVHAMAPQLRRDGRRVAIVLATDGLPTDPDGYIGDDISAEFLSALRSLEGLPVWVVIRLCTDESKVTKFYNSLDCLVNLSLEVLDDYLGEAEEIRRHNKWLNYCLPLHRCRELGYHNRVFDFLDERALTRLELRDFCSVLFGTPPEQIPDPTLVWKDFLKYIEEKLGSEQEHFDPMMKKMGPWIYVKVLHRMYGKGNCSIS